MEGIEGMGILPERIRSRIRITETGCWEWMGERRTTKTRGYESSYGRIWLGRKRVESTHRHVYALLKGPISEGLVLDHLCRNPPCCNPAHLEAVTSDENNRRGMSPAAINARKTHCNHGHPFTPDNTGTDARGDRYCRACQHGWQHQYYPAQYARFRAAHPAKLRVARCARGHELIGDNLRLTSSGKKTCHICAQALEERRRTAQDREWQAWLGLDHVPGDAERSAKLAQFAMIRCHAGHNYDLENTMVFRGRRYCRACHAVSEAHRRARSA